MHSVRLANNGPILEEVKITYNNTSKTDSKYGGDYLGFLQIVLPEATILKSITIDGKNTPITPAVTDPEVYEAPGFRPKEGIEVSTEKVGDKNIFGFSFDVPPESRKVIVITYEVVVGEEELINYSLTTAKQPGTLNDPYLLRVYYPKGQKPSKILGLKDRGSWGEYKGELTKDLDTQIFLGN